VDDKTRLGGEASTRKSTLHRQYRRHRDRIGRVFEETFHTVGAPLDIRTPSREFLLHRRQADRRRPARLVTAARATDQTGLRILEEIRRRPLRHLPDGRQSTEDWLKTYTSNASVHAIFRNLCAAILCLQRQ